MTKPLMPQLDRRRRRCSEGLGLGQSVEVAGAITAESLLSGVQILDGETKGIKFNRNIVITS